MTEWPLAAAAALFLAAYAWPILDPRLGAVPRHMCSAATWAVWAVFVVDYGVRLIQAPDRRTWFWRHLVDLLVIALPILRPLRLLRLVTLLRVLNRSAASSLTGRVGLYVSAGSSLLAFVAALAVLDAERGTSDATITSFGDALWWACTTMTTVGYGDSYPVTTVGRCVGVGLMVAGIALLGAVTATLASWLVNAVSAEATEREQSDPEHLRLVAEVERLSRAIGELNRRLEG